MSFLYQRMRENFFDRAHVIRTIERGNARGLSRAGGKTRLIAVRSIKPAPKRRKAGGRGRKPSRPPTSRPGSPPYKRTSPGIQTIFYAFERNKSSVIVGPTRLSEPAPSGSTAQTTAELLEHGGSATIREQSVDGRNWFRRTKRKPKSRDAGKLRFRTRRVRYAERPTMKLAQGIAAPTYPDLWANSVR